MPSSDGLHSNRSLMFPILCDFTTRVQICDGGGRDHLILSVLSADGALCVDLLMLGPK